MLTLIRLSVLRGHSVFSSLTKSRTLKNNKKQQKKNLYVTWPSRAKIRERIIYNVCGIQTNRLILSVNEKQQHVSKHIIVCNELVGYCVDEELNRLS